MSRLNERLSKRLNQILPEITKPSFLTSKGIGNEIACYIFDYTSQDELQVREHLLRMKNHLDQSHSDLKVLHLNLLDAVMGYLDERRLVQKIHDMQRRKGDVATLKALKGPLSTDKVTQYIDQTYKPADFDLILLSGMGSVWPMLRAHNLLNCLHNVTQSTPLVMFYPGSFDGTTLRLFGQITSEVSKPGAKSYYRAFILIPQEPTL